MPRGRTVGAKSGAVKVTSEFQGPELAKALSVMMDQAAKYMAGDTRKKVVIGIMGNRKDPNERDKLLPNGNWRKNTVARPAPLPPRTYTKAGNPIALQQVEYEVIPEKSESMSFDGLSVKWNSYRVGPIGGSALKKGAPRILHDGGTTSRYYRLEQLVKKKKKKGKVKEIPTGGTRWRFSNIKFDNKMSTKPMGPGMMTEFLGPKNFSVKPRPWVVEPFKKVMGRCKAYLIRAKKDFKSSFGGMP